MLIWMQIDVNLSLKASKERKRRKKIALCNEKKRNGMDWNEMEWATLSEHIYIMNKHTRMFQLVDKKEFQGCNSVTMRDICYYICLRDIICLACFIFNSIGAPCSLIIIHHIQWLLIQWNGVEREPKNQNGKQCKWILTNHCSSLLPVDIWAAESIGEKKNAHK